MIMAKWGVGIRITTNRDQPVRAIGPSHKSRCQAINMLTVVCVIAFAGCGPAATPDSGDAQIRAAMKLLGLEYGGYLTTHNAAPPDEAALRKYLQTRVVDLSAYGVKSVDDLLRAGRDGQAIKVIYGAKVPSADRPDYAWAAYELNGVEGTRLACDSRGGVHEVDNQVFNEQLVGK